MKPFLRSLFLLSGASLLLGGDCMFGRPIVDEQSRYYPSDGVIACTGTRCASLPEYELALPPPLNDSPCAEELPTAELGASARAGALLAGMRYELASERPLELNLGTLDLRDVCLVLSGPVRLTLGANSKLTRVTVLLGPTTPADADPSQFVGRGTPNLYLGFAELDRVVLQAIEETKPSGSAQIEFSSCAQCETRIDSLNVTESSMKNSRLGASTLNIVGGAFDTVELTFDYGLLAGLLANDLRTASCSTLSLVGSTIAGRASQIGPCNCLASTPGPTMDAGQADASEPDASEPDAGEPDASEPDAGQADAGQLGSTCNGATISQTTFMAGMIDGKVHAENSSFQSVLFARHAPTSLDIWNGQIALSLVCDQPMDMRLDKTAGIGCTSCDWAKTTTACALNTPPELLANTCKSFALKLPACEPPLPIMRTPLTPVLPNKGK